MKKFYFYLLPILIFTLALVTPPLVGTDLGVPDVQSVYGGRINAITGYIKHADSSRIIVTTESANTAFFADMYTAPSGTPVITDFKVIPAVSDTANFGSSISKIAVHPNSGYFYFVANSNLYTAHPDSTSAAIEAVKGGVADIFIKGDNIFAVQSGTLMFGTLDATNNFTPGTGAPIALPAATNMQSFIINPVNGKIMIFDKGTVPKLYISTDDYTSISATTTFTDVSPTLTSSGVTWTAFDVAPDGRYFIGGNDNSSKFIAYSDDNGLTYTEFDTGINGVSSSTFAFGGVTSAYYVYFSSIFSNNKGVSSTWANFGNTSSYTHPNDGAVFADPNNINMVYMTTDQGLGVSVDQGPNVASADGGLEAVQVNDMEMTADKNTAWIASKSGIRKVTGYQTTTPTWTNAMFPMNDGSPYYSVAMKPSNANVAYAGNLRVYKTTDGGTNWSKVFTPESAPYSYANVGTKANAITICPYDENIVMAGYELSGTDKGGLFFSLDAGATWSQQLLFASSGVNDVDVNDIVFTQESGKIVAYVGVDYDLSTPTGRSVYKLVQSGSGTGTTWTVTQDMDAGTTSTGSLIVATIKDLEYSTTSNTVYAAGTDAGTNHPISYSKDLGGTALWTPYTTSGFPTMAGKIGRAVTYGVDTLYVAVDNEVYYFPTSGSAWKTGYTYPNGTNINFLFFDDLLVGTGTGLYAQAGPSTAVAGVDDYFKNANGNLSIYPNPVRSGENLNIKYSLTRGGDTNIAIYDIQGRAITTLKKGQQSAGSYEYAIPSYKLKTGVYFVTIKSNNTIILSKKVLVQ